jgi:hypothetical protein
MTMGHYLKSMNKLTKQWSPANYREPKRQRFYLKDIDCPEQWHTHLQKLLPSVLFYLNDNIDEIVKSTAPQDRMSIDSSPAADTIAPAGDLMSSLPPQMRAENMMCYIGHEGTYTPAHREMCASLGQNIMVENSDNQVGEEPGSSIWFMTETKDREVVSEYFLSMLGHDIEVEAHFAQINAWKKAPFPVYIVEQKVGDFILIPPLAPHQVWNRGTRTIKVAWNRTTVDTLEMAIREALPRARLVCRDEQYKNKAIIYYTLIKYYDLLKLAEASDKGTPNASDQSDCAQRVLQVRRDFKQLHKLYTKVLLTEMFDPDQSKLENIEFVPFDSNVTCSYCRCNIFNRFLTCKTCIGEIEGSDDEDTYDICMECYIMGRSCTCISNFQWVEQWSWDKLIQQHEQWREMVIANGRCTNIRISPQTLEMARLRRGKKTAAQICQEQLKARPWRDITKEEVKEPSPGDSDEEPEIDDEALTKRKKAARRKSQQMKAKSSHSPCHICKHREWNWKLAFCTTCSLAYCYGVLWRAFDLMPQTVMENINWQCPQCLNICSCGSCRRKRTQVAYRPKGTLLGHDTKKVADIRSVESLVDFSRTNLGWLRGAGDDDPQGSQRMQKLMKKAEAEKARIEASDDNIIVNRFAAPSEDSGWETTIAIDPLLEDFYAAPSEVSQTTGTGAVTPVAPMVAGGGFCAAEENHLTFHRPVHNKEQSVDESVSLDRRALPKDTSKQQRSGHTEPPTRGMGLGYYQQGNDGDRILFDAPDASTPDGKHPNLAYPRLSQEPLENEPQLLKRKRPSKMVQSINSAEDTNGNGLQASKKQRLTAGKHAQSMDDSELPDESSSAAKRPAKTQKDGLQNSVIHDEQRSTPRQRRSRVTVDKQAENGSISCQPLNLNSSILDSKSSDEAYDLDDGDLTPTSLSGEMHKAKMRKFATMASDQVEDGPETREAFTTASPSIPKAHKAEMRDPATRVQPNPVTQKNTLSQKSGTIQVEDSVEADNDDALLESPNRLQPAEHQFDPRTKSTQYTRSNAPRPEQLMEVPWKLPKPRHSVHFLETPWKLPPAVQSPPVIPNIGALNEAVDDPEDSMFVPEEPIPPPEAGSSGTHSWSAREVINAETIKANRHAKMTAMRHSESELNSLENKREATYDGSDDSDTIVVSPAHLRSPGAATLRKASSFKPARAPSNTPVAKKSIFGSKPTRKQSFEANTAPKGKLRSLAERKALEGKKVKIVSSATASRSASPADFGSKKDRGKLFKGLRKGSSKTDQNPGSEIQRTPILTSERVAELAKEKELGKKKDRSMTMESTIDSDGSIEDEEIPAVKSSGRPKKVVRPR